MQSKRWIAAPLAGAALAVLAWHGTAQDPAFGPDGGNQPPVCCIGPDCTQIGFIKLIKCAGAETTYVLDGSNSYDPDGDPLSFRWQTCPNSTVDDPNAAVTTLRIDTSMDCSQTCGVRLVVSDGKAVALCRVFVQVLEDVDICDTGKPSQIEMVYTGEDCGASNFAQAASGVTCNGDPGFADPVWITVSMVSQPNRIYFDGAVGLNMPFVIDGAGQPSGKVAPNSRVQIFDMQNGNLLQETTFHTSCSQPLEVGDQFGGAIVTDFTP